MYGWRKLAYDRTCQSIYSSFKSYLKNHLWRYHHITILEKRKRNLFSHKGPLLQPLCQVRPVDSVLSKQLVIPFAWEKIQLGTVQYQGKPRAIQLIRHHKHIWVFDPTDFRLVLKSWYKVSISAQRDSEGLPYMGWIMHCNTERRRQFC